MCACIGLSQYSLKCVSQIRQEQQQDGPPTSSLKKAPPVLRASFNGGERKEREKPSPLLLAAMGSCKRTNAAQNLALVTDPCSAVGRPSLRGSRAQHGSENNTAQEGAQELARSSHKAVPQQQPQLQEDGDKQSGFGVSDAATAAEGPGPSDCNALPAPCYSVEQRGNRAGDFCIYVHTPHIRAHSHPHTNTQIRTCICAHTHISMFTSNNITHKAQSRTQHAQNKQTHTDTRVTTHRTAA
jgi:hypothetical protein